MGRSLSRLMLSHPRPRRAMEEHLFIIVKCAVDWTAALTPRAAPCPGLQLSTPTIVPRRLGSVLQDASGQPSPPVRRSRRALRARCAADIAPYCAAAAQAQHLTASAPPAASTMRRCMILVHGVSAACGQLRRYLQDISTCLCQRAKRHEKGVAMIAPDMRSVDSQRAAWRQRGFGLQASY